MFSNFLTGGDSSELLTKHDRRNTTLPEMIEAFRAFTPPDLVNYQIYHKKFPKYDRDNIHFYLFKPTEIELEIHHQECLKAEEEKQKRLAEAKERRAEQKRMEEELRDQEVAEVDEEAAEVIYEVVANADEVLGDNQDIIDDLVDDLDGVDPGLDDILSGLRTRSGRVPRPSTRLRDYYS